MIDRTAQDMIWTIDLWKSSRGEYLSMVGVFDIKRTGWEQVFFHGPSFCDHPELSEAKIGLNKID